MAGLDCDRYWQEPPPEPSPRLARWRARVAGGWRPNRRVRSMGYYRSAWWYGVYVWEYLNVLMPAVREAEAADAARARGIPGR